MADFKWTKQKKQAAWLLGHTSLSLDQIAVEVGITKETIKKWRKINEFSDSVREHERDEFEEMERYPYARRTERVKMLSDLVGKMKKVMEARSRQDVNGDPDTEWASSTGVHTGLVVVDEKYVGDNYQISYRFDDKFHKELRETMKHLAQELGQWDDDEQTGETGNLTIVLGQREDGPR